MNDKLLNREIQLFIKQQTGTDLAKLALRANPFPEVPYNEIIQQIAARDKARIKLPTWFGTDNIIYPSKVSVEQTSSEQTAKHKASIVSGRLIDLTGGFGVDDYYFAQKCTEVVHCEIDSELQQIAAYNFKLLNADNIQSINGDSLQILKDQSHAFDWIYIDPSRRSDIKGKVFMLQDCLPNVPELLSTYFAHSPNILIKTAPILDLTAALNELESVYSIHIVAVENEVKELLFELRRDFVGPPEVKTINIAKGQPQLFNFNIDDDSIAELGLPSQYLYEPNSAIMKSGGFEVIGTEFGLKKLHRHSHLYTSVKMVADFPGRVFEITNSFLYQKAEVKKYLQNTQANVTTRNFPETVENIRKKWKIKDGGDQFCFFTTDVNNDKIVLICTKIK